VKHPAAVSDRLGATDTSGDVEQVLLEGYRRMSPADKLRRVEELNETALQLAAQGMRLRHGALPERELRLRLAALWLNPDLMRRAFGWDPRAHER
jgi:hypothetical protein